MGCASVAPCIDFSKRLVSLLLVVVHVSWEAVLIIFIFSDSLVADLIASACVIWLQLLLLLVILFFAFCC